jgi:spore coat protein CotH
MCISNTKLIVRQNDQILFLLKRTVELNNKIDRLQLEFSTLSEINSSFTENDEVGDNELDEEKEQIKEEKEQIKEEVFELIEPTMNSTTSNKKTGWMSFLF